MREALKVGSPTTFPVIHRFIHTLATLSGCQGLQLPVNIRLISNLRSQHDIWRQIHFQWTIYSSTVPPPRGFTRKPKVSSHPSSQILLTPYLNSIGLEVVAGKLFTWNKANRFCHSSWRKPEANLNSMASIDNRFESHMVMTEVSADKQEWKTGSFRTDDRSSKNNVAIGSWTLMKNIIQRKTSLTRS